MLRKVPILSIFLSTLSLRRATALENDESGSKDISIHALLAESDKELTAPAAGQHRFLSTLSLRRATRTIPRIATTNRHFYPRSPCGERHQLDNARNKVNKFLSTLSLRRATSLARLIRVNTRHFYPRSPCGERRHLLKRCRSMSLFLSTLSLRRATGRVSSVLPGLEFLSTLSLRRATSIGTLRTVSVKNFYPRSPCGERPPAGKVRPWASHISIHALLAESDLGNVVAGLRTLKFLSTLSLRRATPFCNAGNSPTANFYPRSPCGERHIFTDRIIINMKFLSTLSLRRATLGVRRRHTHNLTFLSTLSLRRATQKRHSPEHPQNISIHALLAESDRRVLDCGSFLELFLSTLSLRRATASPFPLSL